MYLSDGECFGSDAFFKRTTYRTTARAACNTEVLALEWSDYSRLLARFPQKHTGNKRYFKVQVFKKQMGSPRLQLMPLAVEAEEAKVSDSESEKSKGSVSKFDDIGRDTDSQKSLELSGGENSGEFVVNHNESLNASLPISPSASEPSVGEPATAPPENDEAKHSTPDNGEQLEMQRRVMPTRASLRDSLSAHVEALESDLNSLRSLQKSSVTSNVANDRRDSPRQRSNDRMRLPPIQTDTDIATTVVERIRTDSDDKLSTNAAVRVDDPSTPRSNPESAPAEHEVLSFDGTSKRPSLSAANLHPFAPEK